MALLGHKVHPLICQNPQQRQGCCKKTDFNTTGSLVPHFFSIECERNCPWIYPQLPKTDSIGSIRASEQPLTEIILHHGSRKWTGRHILWHYPTSLFVLSCRHMKRARPVVWPRCAHARTNWLTGNAFVLRNQIHTRSSFCHSSLVHTHTHKHTRLRARKPGSCIKSVRLLNVPLC